MAIYVFLLMGMALVNSQLTTHCMEDAQCSSGSFCDTKAYSCIKCLNCEEHRRAPPAIFNQSSCLKSLPECGPCFKGLVKVYDEDSISARCLSPDEQRYENWSHLALWSAAIIASVVVISTFIQVLRTTNVYKIHKVSYLFMDLNAEELEVCKIDTLTPTVLN